MEDLKINWIYQKIDPVYNVNIEVEKEGYINKNANDLIYLLKNKLDDIYCIQVDCEGIYEYEVFLKNYKKVYQLPNDNDIIEYIEKHFVDYECDEYSKGNFRTYINENNLKNLEEIKYIEEDGYYLKYKYLKEEIYLCELNIDFYNKWKLKNKIDNF